MTLSEQRREQRIIAAMVGVAIQRSGRKIGDISKGCGISSSALYYARDGKKDVPVKASRSFSGLNLIAAASVAVRCTGLYSLFRYRFSDRHVLARVVELQHYDKLADEATNAMPELLFNKNSRQDLTAEDEMQLEDMAIKLADRMNCTWNLLMELDSRYELNLTKIFDEQNKKAACLAKQTT